MARRTINDAVTAKVTAPSTRLTTRMSTPSPRPAIDMIVSHPATERPLVPALVANETTGPQGSQREEAGDEPGNEVTPLKARWTQQGNVELRPQQRQEKRHGTEHQHAHEFYHRAELCADWADRHRRGQNLRHGIDRQSRQHAILGFGKPQQGMSSGNASTTTTPRIAVKAIEEATSSLSAPMIGATAAIAELPQIELPHAIRTEMRCGRPRARLVA